MISQQVLEEREEWKPRKSNQSYILDFAHQKSREAETPVSSQKECFVSPSSASFKERLQEASSSIHCTSKHLKFTFCSMTLSKTEFYMVINGLMATKTLWVGFRMNFF